jgi:anti-anti-sigma factor
MTGDVTGEQLREPAHSVAQVTVDGRCVVTVRGELDACSAPDVRAAIDEAQDLDVELDLAGVTFIDSSGLAMIVEARQRLMAHDHRLLLGARSAIVQRLLELSGVAGRLDGGPSA